MDHHSEIVIHDSFYLWGCMCSGSRSDAAVSYITTKLGIGKWVHQQGSDLLSFLFL